MHNAFAMLLYVAVSAYGLYKIKAAANLVSLEFAVGFIAYGLGFLLWLYILLRMPLSVAFPIAAGALIVATQLLGYLLLGERITVLHGLGVTAIVVGIALISVKV